MDVADVACIAIADFHPEPVRPGTKVVRMDRLRKFTLVAALCAALSITGPAPARAGGGGSGEDAAAVVTAWNAIAVRTVFDENSTPVPSASVYFGLVSIAVYDATVAIRGGYQPYLRQPRADRRASTRAAAATAAHDVLVHYFPASAGNLAADHAATLAGIRPGSAKAAGQRVGAVAAARLIRHRTGDGMGAPITLDVTPAPGVWRPTPPTVTPMAVPWLGFVRPLALRSPEQPRLPGPDGIGTAAYRRDLAEVRAYGAATGSARTPWQTATALFWSANAHVQYQTALRDQVTRRGYRDVQAARAFAVLGTATTDAAIRCWRAKYDEAFWRPVTAIHEDAVDPDPSWTPLIPTPPYPDYTSGHACVTGAVTGTFAHLFGARSMNVDISSPVPGAGPSRHYDSAAALDAETMNARIWLGLHFRRAMTDGSYVGHYAANWVISHHFRRTH
jgi:hypothetical protein